MDALNRTLIALAATGFACLPAFAGTFVKERRVTETKGEGTTTELVELVVDGGKARITMSGAENPMLAAGGYMLVRDNAFFIVNPSERTYVRMDEAEMQAMGAEARQMQAQQEAAMEAQGGGGKKTLAHFEFKQLVDEEGPVMLGLPTRHYKFLLKYKVSQALPGQMPGMTMDETVDRTEEFWATTAAQLNGPADMGLADSFMGGEEGDGGEPAQILQAEQTMEAKGLKLRSIVELKESSAMGGAMGAMARLSTLGMAGGSDKSESRRTTEVLELRQATVPAGTFDVPGGYREVSMMGPGRGMPDLDQVPGEPGSEGMPDLDKLPGEGN